MSGAGHVASSEAPDSVGLLFYFNARRHTDDSGVVYLMPLVASNSVLHVGSKRLRCFVGDVIAFNDYFYHWTRDEVPCAALIYVRSHGDDPSNAIQKLDAHLLEMLKGAP